MASIAIMVGGAVLNATAFIGGNYLARVLGGGDKAALEEKKRHDKALEAYQAAYAKYTRDRTQLLDWITTNVQTKEQAKQNFTNTDYALKLYNQAHPDEQMVPPRSPSSEISISEASSRKRANSRLWAPALSLWATWPSGSFKFSALSGQNIFLELYTMDSLQKSCYASILKANPKANEHLGYENFENFKETW